MSVREYVEGLSLCFKVDMIRTVTLPHLHLFGIEDGLELQVSLMPRRPG